MEVMSSQTRLDTFVTIVSKDGSLWRISTTTGEMEKLAAGFVGNRTAVAADTSIYGTFLAMHESSSDDNERERVVYRPFITTKLSKNAVDWISKHLAFSLLNDRSIHAGSTIIAPVSGMRLLFFTFRQNIHSQMFV